VKEAEHICERVVPQFQHVNPSVVLAAVKVVFLHMRHISPELHKSYSKKMAPPLGKPVLMYTLSSSDTDII
jgi:AP-1 complex subunit beta-1